MRRRGGRSACAHTVGRPIGDRARLSPATDVRRGRVRCHTLGARRLRPIAASQARAARNGHQFRTAATAAAVRGQPAQKTVGRGCGGGQTSAAAAGHRRPTTKAGPDSLGRRFPIVGLPDSSIATPK